ncbi:flagellar export chaperone FliS [Halalkalibacter alkaliphilus]|uniref:Flagellar secretion chaperone FliS n=1 Tax=Halalkalibacter alkaliphilus TaxID=2917993 RepID=A0A9X2I6C5_9BACI|nr:flagellar export chaperone FliS [Halalkalibacter alkaliphilus]MCL7747145.1 flagellar export chaperone FliS [Halalkalibacter alkaliphilus]
MTSILTEEALHQKSSQEITALLYEACLTNMEGAIQEIDNKDFIKVNEKLQKASAIVHRLGAGLNYEAGIIADQLEQIYNYLADKLVEANFKKDKVMIEDAIKLLTSLMNAWNEALKKKQDQQPIRVKRKIQAYESYSIYDNK